MTLADEIKNVRPYEVDTDELKQAMDTLRSFDLIVISELFASFEQHMMVFIIFRSLPSEEFATAFSNIFRRELYKLPRLL